MKRRSRWARIWWRCAALLLVGSGVLRAAAQAPTLLRPAGIAFDAAGNLYIADSGRNQVLESTVGGMLLVFAGTGQQGFGGDGGAATAALLNAPQGVAVGPDGTVYIADTGNDRVRAIRASGNIHTVVGSGVRGFAGDGGDATLASLNRPLGVAVSAGGALLLADTGNNRVRSVSAGIVTTLAGSGRQGFGGDGGAATAALLDSPAGVALGADGRVWIADTRNARLRVVSLNGTIATAAGAGTDGFGGDGGAATQASLSRPRSLAVQGDGSVLIADEGNQRVRLVSQVGTITTLAGSGVQGVAVAQTSALAAALNGPCAVAVSPFGYVVFVDGGDGSVRTVVGGNLVAAAGFSTPRVSSVHAVLPAGLVYGAGAANITVSGAVGVPRGQVQVLESGTPVSTASLVQGSAALDLSLLSAGNHALAVAYMGDGFNPAASTSLGAVTVAPATATAIANPVSVAYGQPLPRLMGSLTGIVARDVSNVTAIFSAGLPALAPPGSYAVTAALAGPASGNYVLANTTTAGALTVTKSQSSTTLQTPAQTYAGLPLTLTATVAPAFAGEPGGQVAFFDGATQVATGQLVNGVATAVYLAPSSGAHALSATYSGDADFVASTSANVVATVQSLPDFTLAVSGPSHQTAGVGTTATYSFVIAPTAGAFSGAVSLSASGLPAGTVVSFAPPSVVPGAAGAGVVMSVPTALLLSQTRRTAWIFFAVIALPLVTLRKRRVGVAAACCVVSVAMLSGCGTRTVSEAAGPSKRYTITVTATGTNLAGAVVTHTAAVQLTVE